MTVDDYIASVPKTARARFDELRSIVLSKLPHASEVVSYGVLGYKPDPKKRAVVFIGGFKDHISLYPVPKDAALQSKLEPYIKGKGTLWFSISEPLPNSLIKETLEELSQNE
jgi:uncharacterized protein YdhG (YjbR/CyaY superfamily)